ncbi:hypothetical protein [Mycolicibacterium psychrotolerans]|uniref:Thioesterase n=1 Tax=Mycolicibacterium psychrotolerans TaxID=216929 RepID=A0A7I7MHI4_9MYCO|nr:hypothetical protein [Mycolicibacterium psychrotolerans]BBX70973.1 hypothetical protein MPSYJ_44340 [Mycolicibacterium psychrotolerans]
MGTAQPIHALFSERPAGGMFDQTLTIEMLAARTLSPIQDQQPQGPISIVAYTFGVILAYEAAQSSRAGRQAGRLAVCVLETQAPPMAHWKRAKYSPFFLARLQRLRISSIREQCSKCLEVSLRVLRHGRGGLWPAVTDTFVDDLQSPSPGRVEYHDGPVRVRRLTEGDHRNQLERPQVNELARIMLE